MRLSFFPIVTVLLILSLTSGCEKDPYDDDQYGNTCLVTKFRTPDQGSVTFDYDQHDFLSSFTQKSSTMPPILMTVTYNNNIAFADYYADGQRLGSTEATLDSLGYIMQVQSEDSTGNNLGTWTLSYDTEHHLTHLHFYDFANQKEVDIQIDWQDGNAVRFHTPNGTIDCQYDNGVRSSLHLGSGNVALLSQLSIPNIAFCFSKDLLKTYDTQGVEIGEPIYVEYDFDSHDKVRKLFFSSSSGAIKGQTEVSYFCYD